MVAPVMLYGCALKSILTFLENEPLEGLILGCARVDWHLCCCARHDMGFLGACLLDRVACTRC